jgi:NAD-dependent DNA ligase
MMTNFFARQAAEYINELRQSMRALFGIGEGLLADGHLSDREIVFLKRWLEDHSALANEWPADVLHRRLCEVLSDGEINEAERDFLVQTLDRLSTGDFEGMEALADETPISQAVVTFNTFSFCFTGEFAYGPKDSCVRSTERRGGIVLPRVTKQLNYLVVGSLGSKEWKHGSFGTKVQKAMDYKRQGSPIVLVTEETWCEAL